MPPLRPFRMALSNVTVRLQKADADLALDPLFKHKALPKEHQYEATTLTIPGQPRFTREKQLTAKMTGDGEATYGYVSFSLRHLSAAGITNPHRLKYARVTGFQRDYNGDAVVPEEFIIIEIRDRGHLTDGPIFVKCFFERWKDDQGSN